MKSSGRQEIGLVAAWIIVVLGLSSIPYCVGISNSTDELRFTGHVNAVPMDHCTHLAWAKQAYDGEFLLENKFNGSDIQTRMIVNALFLLIGWTGRVLDISVMLAFHVVRMVSTVLLLVVVYQFTSLFLQNRLWKWFALGLISTSAGFAWIEMLGGAIAENTISSDEYIPFTIDTVAVEVSTFWHIRWEVVTTPSVMLLLGVFWLGLKHFETDSTKCAVASAATSLILGLVHPTNLFTIYLVFFLFSIVHNRSVFALRLRPWRLLLLVFAFSAPTLAYNWYVVTQEPILWSYIGIQDDLDPMPLVFGYGLPALFAMLGTFLVWTGRQRELYFLLIWVGSGLVMLYTPIPPLGQVFALDGLHVPICILATVGVRWLVARIGDGRLQLEGHRRTAFVASLLVLTLAAASLTNVMKLANEVALARAKSQVPFADPFLVGAIDNFGHGIGESKPASPYFLPQDLWAAFDWLDKHTDPQDVVFAQSYLSCFIPYLSGNRVYYGHPDLTVRSEEKGHEIAEFFAHSSGSDTRRAFLEERGIAYVLLRAAREMKGSEIELITDHLGGEDLLKLVYQNRRVLIFKVLTRAENRVVAG